MMAILLPVIVAWPVVAALLVRLLGADLATADASRTGSSGVDARLLTLGALLLEAALVTVLAFNTDTAAAGWSHRFDAPWLPDIGASFSLGVDGLSLPMLLMTAWVLPLSLVASWNNVARHTRTFGALILLLTAGVHGVLLALDLVVFYLAWELMLIPTWFLVGIWGTGEARRASLRYVLFTLTGSLLMLVAIIVLASVSDGAGLHLDALQQLTLAPSTQRWLFVAFLLAFAIKSGLVPFHAWLPDAQRAAPTFAAVTIGLKVGIYGLLRFALPLFPHAVLYSPIRSTVVVLSAIAILYGALLALAQSDLRRVISYSAISHLGFIMIGVFALTTQSVQGAVFVMVNHGITATLLFLVAGVLVDRTGGTAMGDFGGLAATAPVFAITLVVAMLATVGLPGTNGFVGEFLVMLGGWSEVPAVIVAASTGVIVAAAYALRATQQLLFGAPSDASRAVTDVTGPTRLVFGTLTLAIVVLGVLPGVIMRPAETPVQRIVERVRFTSAPSTTLRIDPAPMIGQRTAPTATATVPPSATREVVR
jgi:NADH-quinone oxidoreductase subunit M